jgi:hypothetical protein
MLQEQWHYGLQGIIVAGKEIQALLYAVQSLRSNANVSALEPRDQLSNLKAR